MKKDRRLVTIVSFIMMVLLGLSLAGCSNDVKEIQEQNSNTSAGEVKRLVEAFAEQPVILTSVGQSADVQMVKALMDKSGIDYELNIVVKPEELGTAKTLVLAVGGSSKGLGAAGIKAEDELARTEAVISRAKEMDIKIISLHIGGEARRGELSDKFVDAAVPKSDYIIIVEEGNKDGLFTQIASSNDIPMDAVKNISDVAEQLKKAFK